MGTKITIELDADLEPRVIESINIAIAHGLALGRKMFPGARANLPPKSYTLTAITWTASHQLAEAVAALACVEGFTLAGDKLPELVRQVH